MFSYHPIPGSNFRQRKESFSHMPLPVLCLKLVGSHMAYESLSNMSPPGKTCGDGFSLGKYKWMSGQHRTLLRLHPMCSLISPNVYNSFGGFDFHIFSHTWDSHTCNHFQKIHFSQIPSPNSFRTDASQVFYL